MYRVLLLVASLVAVRSATIESTPEYITCQNNPSRCSGLYAARSRARCRDRRAHHAALAAAHDVRRPIRLSLAACVYARRERPRLALSVTRLDAALPGAVTVTRRYLSSRSLTGTIPSEIGQLTALQNVYVPCMHGRLLPGLTSVTAPCTLLRRPLRRMHARHAC
jgi:hypothetical protein